MVRDRFKENSAAVCDTAASRACKATSFMMLRRSAHSVASRHHSGPTGGIKARHSGPTVRHQGATKRSQRVWLDTAQRPTAVPGRRGVTAVPRRRGTTAVPRSLGVEVPRSQGVEAPQRSRGVEAPAACAMCGPAVREKGLGRWS